jgi:hypothetical protein
MPQGVHKSKRVALAVPEKLHEQLEAWAQYEGRPVASLCLYLVENSLRQAQREGIAPSFRTEGDHEDPIDSYQFDGVRNIKMTAGVGPFKKETTVTDDMSEEEWKEFRQWSDERAKEGHTVTRTPNSRAKEGNEDKKAALLSALSDLLT